MMQLPRTLLWRIKWCLAIIGSMALGYLGCYHHTEATEVGVVWNTFSGTITRDHPGHHLTPPWAFVAKLDTRPVRVCVTSASRSVNCMLVQFDESHYEDFVRTEGFRYYWWDNRFSFNSGYSEEYRGFKDVMRGYAYSVKKYPFIKVIETYEDERY